MECEPICPDCNKITVSADFNACKIEFDEKADTYMCYVPWYCHKCKLSGTLVFKMNIIKTTKFTEVEF